MRARSFAVVALGAVAVLAACGSDKPASTTATSSTTAPRGVARRAVSGSITVFAAASLKNAFTGLGKEFEAANAGVHVTFSFGSSTDLEQQIARGAPADVFASADHQNMDELVAAHDNAGAPQPFARNRLEIAVEKGNPKHIGTLADLAKAGTVVVLCDVSVPCGKFADDVLTNARVNVTPASREANVKAALAKVELGEADAAIVYASDVASSGRVDGVAIPDPVNVVTTLPVVALGASKNPPAADAFVAFVVAHRSELAAKFGFLPL